MNTIKQLLYQLWASKSILKARVSTSLSDNQIYPNFCLKASNNMAVFASFRQNPVYRQILEHVSPEHAKEYLSEINKYPDLLKNIDLFKQNDLWGAPRLHTYDKIGKISSTTLRYIKVLNDLRINFGDLNNSKICEIGVGYGGQCRIINSLYKPKKYCLVDIKPALLLTQRYLDNFVLNSSIEYKTMNELEPAKYDLVISNYAFTELPRVVQDVYLKRIILHSANGYITYNENTMDNFNSYKKEDLLKIIPNSRIIDEVPLTAKGNCIIVWNSENKAVLNSVSNGAQKAVTTN
jgi:hypothetical protein